MGKKFLTSAGIILVIMVALLVVFSRLSAVDAAQRAGEEQGSMTEIPAGSKTPAEGRASTDPQRLMIPRWFLTSLTVNGETIAVPEGSISIQFEADGNANGSGGCNSYFSQYQASDDGVMQFGAVGATKMFCENTMEAETAYFEALSQVDRFKTEDWKLFLSSADGKTALVFSMPPK